MCTEYVGDMLNSCCCEIVLFPIIEKIRFFYNWVFLYME